jgi:Tetratricopeptide repeat
MKAVFCALLLLAAGSVLPLPLMGQQQGGGNISQTNRISGLLLEERAPKRWDIAGKVVTLQGDPVPDAKVRAETDSPAKSRSLSTDSAGEFKTTFQVRTQADAGFHLRLTVKKKGFLTANELIEFSASGPSEVLPITLRPAVQDEDFLSQKDLISNVGPKLRKLGPSDGLSAKAEKDYAQGVADFLDRSDPGQAIASLAKVVKRDSACPKCWTMLALAELDAGDFDGAVRDASVPVSRSQKDQKTGSPEASLFLGVVQSWKSDPSGAADHFAQALAEAPQDALALQEMGRAQLQNRNWESADSYLAKAIAAGARPEARLLRVKALLGEGKTDQATAEMIRYLGHQKLKDMPLRVHLVWDAIQDQKALKATYGKSGSAADSVDYFQGNLPELKGLQTAKSQEPLENILRSVGKNVLEFFQDFQNTSSLEEVQEEQLSQRGKVHNKLDQKFRYLCLISGEGKPPFFQEYRRDLSGGRGEMYALKQGFMLTAGFVSASLNFHPDFQSESTFRYIGRQRIDGRETYVVAFAQQPLKTKLSGGFKYGVKSAATYTRGLAWIDARNYQILRLRTDLLKPLPQVKLKRQTTEIEYQEVRFKSSHQGFWLPRQVAVTVEWNGRIMHNEHRYSDFELFDVRIHEKIGKPKNAGQATESPESKSPL